MSSFYVRSIVREKAAMVMKRDGSGNTRVVWGIAEKALGSVIAAALLSIAGGMLAMWGDVREIKTNLVHMSSQMTDHEVRIRQIEMPEQTPRRKS
jgi:hypothetical protein